MEDKQGYPSDVADKVLVRMPDGMRDRLKAAAKDRNRTMNAEIVARLDESFGHGASDEAIKALALRLAETELELRKSEVLFDNAVRDAFLAASAAFDAVEFNKLNGLPPPLDDQDIEEATEILNHNYRLVLGRGLLNTDARVAALEEAQQRFDSLSLKPKVDQRLEKRQAAILEAIKKAPKSL